MARTRKRSQSGSSVETVDHSDIHWKQERSILRTVGKDLDQDLWPTFEMVDVTIYASDGTTMTSGLAALSKGPLIVRGIVLIEEPEQKARRIQRVGLATHIEIPACRLYSIGETDTAQPIIWMGGHGGWYEIKPSAAYVPIHDKMCEAVALYYRIVDIHKEIYDVQRRRKTVQRADIRDIFPKYAEAIGDGSTWQDVCDRCCEHGAFLLERFESDDKLEDYPSLPWRKSVIYSWLQSQKANFPKVATNRAASDADSSRGTSRSPPSARLGRQASPVLPSIEAKPAKKPTPASTAGPSRAQSGIESKPILAIEPLADPFNDPPLRTLLAALDGELMNEKTTITPKKLLNNFYFKYKFPTYKPETKSARGEGVHRRPVEEVFHRNAKDLLKLIDKDKYGAIYDWLAELSKTPLRLLALKPSDFPYRIVPRDTTARKAQVEQSAAAAAATPLALRRRSSTRPQTPPRAGKSTKTPGRSSKSVLRPIKSTKKRGRDSDDDDSDESEMSPSKKPQYLGDEIEVYEDMDLDVPEEDGDDNSSDEDSSSDSRTPTTKPAPMMKLFSEKISTVIPRGNAKSWLCTESDCGFAVRSGDDLADRATMKEHMEEHRQASRMDIIMSEQRAHLPISNLLEKVQAMGQSILAKEAQEVNGQVVKDPIKKKLLV